MNAKWQTKTLGEILQKTETTNPLQSPEVEFQYIDVSSVSNSTFQTEVTHTLKGKDAPSRARRLVKTNDVLFATIRPTLRRIAVVPEHLDKQVCSTGYFVLRPKAEIDHRFLFYWLFTEGFMGQMEQLQKGASYPAVTDAEVRAQMIPFPPLPEQQRIVGILDEAFDGIATAKANAEKNLQNARALFESHLQSVFTQHGKGWAKKGLDEFFVIGSSKRVLKSQWQSEGVPFFRGREITKLAAEGFVDNELFISEDLYKDFSGKYGAPNAGDIMITAIGTIGNSYIVKPEDRFYFKDASVLWLKKSTEISSEYVNWWIKSPLFISQLEKGNGATVDTLTIQKLQSMQLVVPSSAEQAHIVEELDALREETQRLAFLYQRKLAALAELKKSLLHQAFAGEL